MAEYRLMVAPVAEGDVLAGKYRVEKVLGAGGMGVVVAAHHLQLDERVALKFLLPTALDVRELVARFSREARVAVKIKSEHVARIIDVGSLDNGAPYMVMEYLQGQDLAQLLQSQGVLPVADAVDYLLQACEAIAEAHSLGIVHRDLKPANLFLTRRADGSACIKVLDFGISKVSQFASNIGDASFSMTSTSALLGSPYYMSPEQIASAKSVDTRTDIWALGVIAYQLLSGQTPFNGENIGELCASILQHQPASLVALNRAVPQPLALAIGGALEKNREQRYDSVAAFVQALAPFAPARAQLSVQRVSSISHVSRRVGPAIEGPPDPGGASAVPAVQPVPQAAALADVAEPGTLNEAWNRSAPRSQSLRSSTRLSLIILGVAMLAAVAFVAMSQWRQASTAAVTVSPSSTFLAGPVPVVASLRGTEAELPKPPAAVPITIEPISTARVVVEVGASVSSRPISPTRPVAKSKSTLPAASALATRQPEPVTSSPSTALKAPTNETHKPSITDLLDARH